jgi:mRNA interferase RelE/StbE
MSYRINLSDRARKQLLKFDHPVYLQPMKALGHLATLENPRDCGKPLAGPLKNFWRYMTGDYRILAEILDAELLILAVEISNRRDVYRQT